MPPNEIIIMGKTKDHYVAQTYLRNFTGEDGLLKRYYKLPPPREHQANERVTPKAVCYLPNGDRNNLFPDPKIINEYLKIYEQNWQKSIEEVISGNATEYSKENLAGYIMYMQHMTPRGRLRHENLHLNGLNLLLDLEYEKLSKKPDLSEDEKLLLEGCQAIKDGKIKLDIDQEVIHAKSIEFLFKNLPHISYTASKWTFLENSTSIPFVTCDHPVCFMDIGEKYMISRTYVPLTQTLALIITPHMKRIEEARNIFESSGKIAVYIDLDERKKVNPIHVKQLNDLLIKQTPELIITAYDSKYVHERVEKFKNFSLIDREITYRNENDGSLLQRFIHDWEIK